MKAEITTANAQAVVLASSTEVFQLWCLYAGASDWQYAPGSARKIDGQRKLPLLIETGLSKVDWREQSRGFMTEIGRVADRPICAAVSFATIDGVRVAFVDGCSQLVDHKMIDEWIDREMPQTKGHSADAMNWRNALLGLKPDPLPDVPDPPPYVPPPAPPPPGPFTLPDNVSPAVDAALRMGATMHAFRSGGGLRVVDLHWQGNRFYGEHPHLGEALRILADDFRSGSRACGRAYADVFGRIETHYLTGDSTPADALDAWVLRGNTIDARAEGPEIVVELKGFEQAVSPPDLVDRCHVEGEVRWTDERGVTFVATPSHFPGNDERCASIVPDEASLPPGITRAQAFHYAAVREGRASDFVGAAAAALAAKPRMT